MNWKDFWLIYFNEPPSPATVKVLDELLCLVAADDPVLLIAMFFQRQHELFDQRDAVTSRRAEALERSAGFLQDCAKSMTSTATAMQAVTSSVTHQAERAAAAVEDLEDRVFRFIDRANSFQQVGPTAVEITNDQPWWQTVPKLVAAVTAFLVITAIALMAAAIFPRPAISIETAAAVLVGRDAAPNLIVLQQAGDLKAILDCSGAGWSKNIGYCQPIGGKAPIRGWNTAPSASVPERAAPFAQE